MTIHARVMLVAIAMTLAGPAGCGRGAADEPPPATSAASAGAPAVGAAGGAATVAPREITSSAGTYHVICVMPDPVPLNEPFDLEVRVLDGSDRVTPADQIDLVVDGRMPEHRHGMNVEPLVTRRGDGRFEIEGMRFHMPGYWEIHLDAVAPDGAIERAQIAVTLE